MSVGRLFDGLQLAALACLAWLALRRALALRARGIRVFVVDRRRTLPHMLGDLLTTVCLLLWWYELLAHACPLPTSLAPPALDVVVVDAVGLKAAGAALMAAGLVVYGLAVQAMGDSWRIGIDRAAPGALVTSGIFAWTRNPVYVSFFLLILGTFAVQGRLVYVVLALGLAVGIHGTVRREERFLGETFGDAYRDYCRAVGRYVTLRRPRRRQ